MVSMQRIITYINDFTLSPRQNGRLVEDGIVKVFSEEKILCFDPVSTDVCFERSHCKKKSSVGSYISSNQQQAIEAEWRIYESVS